jgi:hypothetical protein
MPPEVLEAETAQADSPASLTNEALAEALSKAWVKDDATQQQNGEAEAKPGEKPDAPKPEPTLQDVLKEFTDYKDAMQKKVDGLEKLTQRHANEVGEHRRNERLRKEEAERKQKEDEDKFNAEFLNNPKAAIENEIERRESSKVETQRQIEELRAATKEHVIKQVPELETLYEEIESMVKADVKAAGGNPDDIRDVRNALFTEHPALIIQMAQRALLKRENLKLRKEVEDVKVKQGKHLDDIDKAARSRAGVNGKSGQGAPTNKRALTPDQIASLGTEDLKRYLSELQREEGLQ